jgi:hypothetical protein
MKTTDTTESKFELPAWLWLWSPLALLVGVCASHYLGRDTYMRVVLSEWGILENLTVLFLFVAIVAGARLLVRGEFPDHVRSAWVALLTLGCIYFAGEEASWGQHWIGWATPETWAALNDQQETNIHNTIGLFDQIPRSALAIGALVGGVIVPVLRRRDPHSTANFWNVPSWYWGTLVCAPAALLAVGISIPGKLAAKLGVELPHLIRVAPGECKELYLGMFLMIYVLSMSKRMPTWKSTLGFVCPDETGESGCLVSPAMVSRGDTAANTWPGTVIRQTASQLFAARARPLERATRHGSRASQ